VAQSFKVANQEDVLIQVEKEAWTVNKTSDCVMR
jgi:hypothetical protein